MGKLVVTIGVGDQQGRQFEDLEVTVDTGSTFTAVPRALLQRLGVPVRRSARSRLADGSSRVFSFSCLVGKAHHVESFAEMGIVAA